MPELGEDPHSTPGRVNCLRVIKTNIHLTFIHIHTCAPLSPGAPGLGILLGDTCPGEREPMECRGEPPGLGE